MKRSDLIGMSAEFEETSLGDQIPKNDVGVLGATSKTHADVVKSELSDSRFVAVEGNNDRTGSGIPDANATIFVPERQ